MENLNSQADFQHLGDSVSQSNLTRLGNFSIQTNVLIRLGDSASQRTPQNNGTRFNAASQTNGIPERSGSSVQSPKLASAGPMEIDFNCQTATFKSRANKEGVTLKEFVYTYKCVPGWDQFWDLAKVKVAIEGISVALEKEAGQIQPQLSEVFKALTVTPEKIKAVILGQDPTPQAGKATGLAFSLLAGQDPREVPSVLNMLVELKLEGFQVSLGNGDLTPWVTQGVMLLNAALTLRIGEPGQKAPNTHSKLWEPFTEQLVEFMNNLDLPLAWILWGVNARASCRNLDKNKHYCRDGSHPAARSTSAIPDNFFGRNFFKCANDFLSSRGREMIDWSLAPRPGSPPDLAPCELR